MESSSISALLPWPESTDYPYFRHSLPLLTQYVKPTICITPQGGIPIMGDLLLDLTEHGCQVLRSHQLSSDTYPGDWRNAATNHMIDSTTGEWILFMEQDFFIHDYPLFFHTVQNALLGNDIIMFEEGNRYHPAFLLVKRELVDKTSRDFSSGEVGMDHFAKFSQELKALKPLSMSLEQIGLQPGRDWWHMRGLTDNYFAPKPYFDLPSFYTYNWRCMSLSGGVQEKSWFDKMCRLNAEMPPGTQLNKQFNTFLQGY